MSKSYIQSVKELFESDETSYNIALQTGLVPQFIDNYRVKGSKIENMALEKAEILVNYYEKGEKPFSVTEYEKLKKFIESDIIDKKIGNSFKGFNYKKLIDDEILEVRFGKITVIISYDEKDFDSVIDHYLVDYMNTEVHVYYIAS